MYTVVEIFFRIDLPYVTIRRGSKLARAGGGRYGWRMRRRLMMLAMAGAVGCGGGQKKAAGPAVAEGGAGNEDLHIPKVDEKLCDTKDKKVMLFDLNHDGKPDVWKLYEQREQKGTNAEVMTCKQVDLNHDGKKDYVAEYDENGNIIAEEYDFDFDG